MLRPETWRKVVQAAHSGKTKLPGWSSIAAKDLMNFLECRAPDMELNN